MNKKIIFGVFLLFLSIQIICAAETEINIKTLPSHEVQIVVHDANSAAFELIARETIYSDGYGDAQLKTNINGEFKLKVYIKTLNHEKVYGDSFSTTYSPGDEIYLEVAPTGFEFIETPEKPEVIETPEVTEGEDSNETTEENLNETEAESADTDAGEVEETEITDEEAENEPGMIGNVISDVKEVLFKPVVLYIIGGVILLIIILLVIIKIIRRKSKSSNKEIIVRKLSEIDSRKENLDENKEDIEKLENKLKSIQEEISNLKKKGNKSNEELEAKITETKKRIREDEERLVRLRNQKRM